MILIRIFIIQEFAEKIYSVLPEQMRLQAQLLPRHYVNACVNIGFVRSDSSIDYFDQDYPIISLTRAW